MTNTNNNTRNLVKLPAMPSSARAKTFVDCACGCGGQTQSRFVPGHDSRLRGWMLRVERGIMTLEEIAAYATQGEADATEREMAGLNVTPPAAEQVTDEA